MKAASGGSEGQLHGEASRGDAQRQAILREAIREKRRLSFIYNTRRRIVEPQCLGLGAKGTGLLRAYQISGGSQLEPLFNVLKISHLVIMDETFDRPWPHYKRGDSAMATIFCEL